VIEDAVRAGETSFPKPAFVKKLHKIRMKGLKAPSIRSAWRKCGLIPLCPSVVLSKIKELEAEPQPRTLEHTPPVSSPLRRTPRTVPQFAKGARYLLELLGTVVKHLDPNDPANNQVMKRAQRLFKGERVSTVAGQEAIEQVETAAIKRQDELRAKELSKNFQLRKGGVMTATQGREIWDAREVAEQSAKQRKAAKLAKKAEEEEEAEKARQAAEEAKQERRCIANE
jgi:hypothetical protein